MDVSSFPAAAANKDQSADLHALAILRRPQVEALTGLSTSSLYDAIKGGRFPSPIRLFPGTSNRSVGWLAHEVREWLESRRPA